MVQIDKNRYYTLTDLGALKVIPSLVFRHKPMHSGSIKKIIRTDDPELKLNSIYRIHGSRTYNLVQGAEIVNYIRNHFHEVSIEENENDAFIYV